MRLLLTGASGYLGGFIAARARAEGTALTVLGRKAPDSGGWLRFDLDAPPSALPAADALVHAAFSHVPGRYRGGEGDDADGFVRRNRDGSARLFDAAQAAGIGRVVFLSSRAVYGPRPPGTRLREDDALAPDTLYGRMKADTEADLHARATPGFTPSSLRITGVYGQAVPGTPHKWADLLSDFAAGRPIAPRIATEVHGADMAAGLWAVLTAPPGQVTGRAFNLSDLMLDRHELLSLYADLHGIPHAPPDRAPGPPPNEMACDSLAALGWQPGGLPRLRATLAALPPGG
ncbi:NAD-dependent dehydratase [Meridianimarinicoccus roseus]|uniref:NAD-dependent dehydratase n=1 Tax=Meridianimarinicoccus roseus TaxID=2072018 RepID=A0A2V2LJ11_9RHOB|nr:NAD(P)-dependent oxidoreductase [Meridianimarinicoccus roseus]PWR04021.1 NAD-dependent dehydratase [Meridianimarinicoccus roseus]